MRLTSTGLVSVWITAGAPGAGRIAGGCWSAKAEASPLAKRPSTPNHCKCGYGSVRFCATVTMAATGKVTSDRRYQVCSRPPA